MQKRNIWKESMKELTSVRNLVLCGLLGAMAIALTYVTQIDFGPYVRISFSSIPDRICNFFFGPAVGVLYGAAMDVLKYMVKPSGTFFPGFTLNAMIAGAIYGMILYKNPVSIKRVLFAEFLNKLIVNVCLNTLWLSVLYGQAFSAILPLRALKNAIMWPIDSIILFTLLEVISKKVLPALRSQAGA